MKLIFLFVFTLMSLNLCADDEYNSTTGFVNMPEVRVGVETYAVVMKEIEPQKFEVVSAIIISPTAEDDNFDVYKF